MTERVRVWSALDKLLHGQSVLVILLVISAGTNVLLARKVQRLNRLAETTTREARYQEGELMPPLEVLNEMSTPQRVTYSEYATPTVLYFLSTRCGWCDRNRSNLDALVRGITPHYRVFVIARDVESPSAYVTANHLSYPLFYRPTSTGRLKLGVTPQTIVVSQEGRVLKNWYGAYHGTLLEEVRAFFGVDLPGLVDATSHN